MISLFRFTMNNVLSIKANLLAKKVILQAFDIVYEAPKKFDLLNVAGIFYGHSIKMVNYFNN